MKGVLMHKESECTMNFYIKNYNSGRCVCGDYKPTRLSFCRDCFKSLHEEIKEDIKGEIDREEYRLSWNKAYEHFINIGRVSIDK
jgi:hypothetical protein